MDYDLKFHFTSGNPTPKGTPKEIIEHAKKMYAELSDETDEFFSYTLKYNLIDYLNKPGKANKGYCWHISNYRHPFIFANFNGTSGDIDVLTYPWMEGFFKEDTAKYYYAHLTKRLLFLPFGCAIDHFQHTIYENPEMSADERAAAWNDIYA